MVKKTESAKKLSTVNDLAVVLKSADGVFDGILALRDIQIVSSNYRAGQKVLLSKIEKALKDGKVASLGAPVFEALLALRGAVSDSVEALKAHDTIIGK